jgi:hypothetical protein
MNAPAPQGNPTDAVPARTKAVPAPPDAEDVEETAEDNVQEAEAVSADDFYADPEAFAEALGIPPDEQERSGRLIRKALRACPDLAEQTPASVALWLTIQDEICTNSWKMVRPFGSTKPYLVTADHATDELITAMTWLRANEEHARTLAPLALFVMLRGVATKTSGGSARAAQSDLLHGVTEVPAGQRLTWGGLGEIDAA